VGAGRKGGDVVIVSQINVGFICSRVQWFNR
jgi:hypothetical protein